MLNTTLIPVGSQDVMALIQTTGWATWIPSSCDHSILFPTMITGPKPFGEDHAWTYEENSDISTPGMHHVLPGTTTLCSSPCCLCLCLPWGVSIIRVWTKFQKGKWWVFFAKWLRWVRPELKLNFLGVWGTLCFKSPGCMCPFAYTSLSLRLWSICHILGVSIVVLDWLKNKINLNESYI